MPEQRQCSECGRWVDLAPPLRIAVRDSDGANICAECAWRAECDEPEVPLDPLNDPSHPDYLPF